MNLEIAKTITIVGFVHSIFGILIFATKRPKHLSFNLLIVWLLVISIFLGAALLPFEVVDYFKPGIFPVLFLFGPLLYLYVSSLTIEDFRIKQKHLWHVIPLLTISIHRSFITPVSVLSSSSLDQNPLYIYNKVYYVLLTISLIIYWIFTIKLISKHRKNIPFYFSNYSRKNSMSWLVFVVFLFLVLILTDLLFASVEKVLDVEIIQFLSIHANLTIFTFIIVFFAGNQSVIYQTEEKTKYYSQNTAGIKYKRSALSENQVMEINREIHGYLQIRKPFLSPDFNLQMMVNDLNISRQHLSQVINRSENKNFYKLVNEFRVNEVKEKLEDPVYSHYTLLGIALECGFNSKTSFNRIFKEETGLTPTQYKKSRIKSVILES